MAYTELWHFRLHSVKATLKNKAIKENVYFKTSLVVIGTAMTFYFGVLSWYMSQGWHGTSYNHCRSGITYNGPTPMRIFGVLIVLMSFLTVVLDIQLTLTLKKRVSILSDGQSHIPFNKIIRIPVRATILSACQTMGSILFMALMNKSSMATYFTKRYVCY